MKKGVINFSLLLIIVITSHGQTLRNEWVSCNPQGCRLVDPYFEEGVTFKWSGKCVDGKADGYGVAEKFQNGEPHSVYEGFYSNGIRQGKGRYTMVDQGRENSKRVWQGEFINGQMCGPGTFENAAGLKYFGNFINYSRHGNGILNFPNGGKFEGFFVHDRYYTGKLTSYDGRVTYYQGAYPVEKIVEVKSGYTPEIGKRVTEFFDEKWVRCNQKNAAYYRLVTYEAPNKPIGTINDFYITGQLQSEFSAVFIDYDDEGKNYHEGEATWYYKNGKVEQKRYYLNNHINGLNTYYYENGLKSQEMNYRNGKLNGLCTSWFKTGKPKWVARYDDGSLVDDKYTEYDENGFAALVYNENFWKNKDQWSADLKESVSEITENGELSLQLKTVGRTSRYNYITLNQESDYSVESIIQKKTGKGIEGYGIIFGFKDWDNFYEFLISEYGSFTILGQFEGVKINICDWTKSSSINTGNQRNQLKVLKFGKEFIFSINGDVVKRVESKSLRGNNFGITAGGVGNFIMENLIVKEFLSAEELAQREAKIKSEENNDWKGNGSGFFVNEKGYIATNYHVVEDAKEIQVEYYQKGVRQVFRAKVIVTDKQNDLAIIQIQDPKFKNVPAIPYVFNTSIRDVGSDVFALGYPMADIMGAEIKFTDGKISAKTGIQGDITVYQISVPIQPGNSGGPLFDNKGNLIGITSSALNKEYFNTENVNYAIKSNYLKNLIDVLPESIAVPNDMTIYTKPLTEKIKLLSDYIPLIRVK